MNKMLTTTRGPLAESDMQRTLGFEDRPTTFVIWVEWRHEDEVVRRECYALPKHVGPTIYTTKGDVPVDSLVRTIELSDHSTDIAVAVVWRLEGELVRRDAHVIMKDPSVVANAIAANLG